MALIAEVRGHGTRTQKRLSSGALPTVELEDSAVAAAHVEAADRWLRHFADEGVAASLRKPPTPSRLSLPYLMASARESRQEISSSRP
eukprot:1346515-Pyramimonas_sp.AAC.1